LCDVLFLQNRGIWGILNPHCGSEPTLNCRLIHGLSYFSIILALGSKSLLHRRRRMMGCGRQKGRWEMIRIMMMTTMTMTMTPM
jgi:hypothetical protein